MQPSDRLARLRHLHERDAALLHAGAARGRDHEQRRSSRAQLGGARDPLADGAPHAAADECEVHGGDDQGVAVDGSQAEENALARPGLALGVREPVHVGPRVGEGEDVERRDLAALVDEAVLVEEHGEPLADRDAKVEVAFRTDAEVPSQALV